MSRRKLRIGVVSLARDGTFGGSSIMAGEIAMAMAELGHDIHIISSAVPRSVDLRHDRVRVHRVPTVHDPAVTGIDAFYLVNEIARVARDFSLDVLHAHYGVPPAVAAMFACQILGASAPRLVTTLHGTDVTSIGHDPAIALLSQAAVIASHGVTVPSNFLRDAAFRYFGLPESKTIEVISNFVDTDRFRPAAGTRPNLRNRLGRALSPSVPLIVHASNFRPVKRVLNVISVFAALRQREPARLIMLGDGPEKAAAMALAQELGVAKHVSFLGKIDAFEDVLARADVFLLPSESESFGLAALEALSCGTPVVASDVGGLPELITDGTNGFLTPVGEDHEMAERCLEILRAGSRQKACLRRMARQSALRFSGKDVVARYEAVYHSALER